MGIEEEAQALARSRGPNTRAVVVGGGSLALRVQKDLAADDPQPSNVDSEIEAIYEKAGAVEPPYPPDQLIGEFENSNALRQNVDAYAQNIEGFGWSFEPVFDLDAEDIDAQIADAIFLDLRAKSTRELVPFDEAFEPAPDQIEEMKQRIRIRMRRERATLDLFFSFCCSDRSFTQLRKDSRVDQEILGHAWWEVLRDKSGSIAAFSYVPSFTIRGVRPEGDVIERQMPVKLSPLRWGPRTELHRAIRWVQVMPGTGDVTFFKEFGDPRLISSTTGEVYPDIETMNETDPEAQPATELVQFRVHSSRSGMYGVPRWIGNLKSVLGSRKAETVNLIYFTNKGVPPLVLLVSGGSVTQETVTRLEDFMKNELQGTEENFHKILIIEAEPASEPMDPLNSGKVRVELVPLTKAINSDALFMKYIAAGREMIGESMRNPKIVRGATEALNRATAQASLEFAEAQVYQPERAAFDWWINRFIMPELGVLFWNFRSNSPVSTDLDAAKAVVDLTKAGVLTPAEARRLTARVFNVDLRRINAEWVNQPLQLTLAGLLMTDGGGVSTGETERNVEGMLSGSAKRMLTTIRAARKSGADVVEEVAKLFELRAMAVEGERKQANQDFAHTQDVDEALTGEPEVITLKWPGSIDRYFTPAKKESESD